MKSVVVVAAAESKLIKVLSGGTSVFSYSSNEFIQEFYENNQFNATLVQKIHEDIL